MIVPETSDPGGGGRDAELGEGAIAPVGDGEALLTVEDAAGLCWGTDGDWPPHPIAASAIATTNGAIGREGVRIVIFRL